MLSIVATPIGNLKDITLRALETLEAADAIACEDTRVTLKLLRAYGIVKPLISLHEHASERKIAEVVAMLKEGKHVAYASDAGTPGVNDPGGKLVEAALKEGVQIVPLPGASAVTTAISVCGFPMHDFTYLGFLPHKKGRATAIADLAAREGASVFFESSHRIEKALDELKAALAPDRLVFVGREMTKMHETYLRGTIDEVSETLHHGSLKGEFVLIVAPARFS